MFKKIITLSLIAAISYSAYKYVIKLIVKDKEYLEKAVKKDKEDELSHLINKTIYLAKSFEQQNQFESACEYYMCLVTDLDCDYEEVKGNILRDETRILFNKKLQFKGLND